MKILYLLEDLPFPPDNGVRIKTFNLITYMSRKHECAILSFRWGTDTKREAEFRKIAERVRMLGVFPSCRGLALHAKRLKHLLAGRPASLARWENVLFRAALLRAVQTDHYDLVHLDGLSMASYLPLCLKKPTVISTTDPVSLAYKRTSQVATGLRRPYKRLAGRLFERFERAFLPLASAVHVVSSVDRKYLSSLVPEAHVESIEHGPTDEVLHYLPPATPAHPPSLRLLFMGPLEGGPGKGLLSFLNDAFPQILEYFPRAELVIMTRSASGPAMRRIRGARNVKCLFWAEDYCAEIARSRVVVIPDVAGTGIKTRVLYAMALRKAIVGSPVAFEGVGVQHGVHCFVCRSPEDFVNAVTTLFRDQRLQTDVGANARKLILSRYTPEAVGARWERLYQEAIARFYSGGRTTAARPATDQGSCITVHVQ